MAFVCINRGEPGVVHHLAYGSLSIGHGQDDPAELRRLAVLLRSARLQVSSAPNLLHARWEKLCWNVPFNGLSVAAGGFGTRMILDTPALRKVAETAMREVVLAGNADLARSSRPSQLDGEEVVNRMFALTEAMEDYRTSMVLDYVLGQELEVEAILGEPSRRAAGLGVATPTIDALYALVRAADLRRRGLARPIDVSDLRVEAGVDASRWFG
jgi:2-dehydropantoate 2-reductase